MRTLLALFLVLTLSSCGSATHAARDVVLPSGRHVAVLGMEWCSDSHWGPTWACYGLTEYDAPALMLKYKTLTPLNDQGHLTREVNDVWSAFRREAEQSGLKTVVISAHELDGGFLMTSDRWLSFLYRRGPDGTWSPPVVRSPDFGG